MRNCVLDCITECAREDPSVFLITGDAGFGVLETYRQLFPDRYLNLGVAEQNTIGFSAGLSLAGFKVFVYNIVPFILYRPYEQVRDDICYQRLPVALIGIGSGVTYAPGGMTHYSVEDVALARTLPNLSILSPADAAEARAAVAYAYASGKPVYLRVAKGGAAGIHPGSVDITKPIQVKAGSGVAVLFHGSVAADVLEAVDSLPLAPSVISVPMLQPLDTEALGDLLADTHTIVTVEEHFIEGGLGSIAAEWIVREGRRFRLRKMGIVNGYIHAVNDAPGMRRRYGFAAPDIRKAIEEAFDAS